MKNKVLLSVCGLILSVVMMAVGTLLVVRGGNGGHGTIHEPTPSPVPDAPILSAEEFENPLNKYRGLRIEHDYFRISGANYEKEAEGLKKFGFGGLVTNDAWTATYLNNEKKMAQISKFAEVMKANGLRMWIYDEKGYPSGTGGDQVVEADGKYQAVTLDQISVKGSGAASQTLDVPEEMVEAYKAYLTTDKKTYTIKDVAVVNGKLRFDGLAGDWTGYVYYVANHGSMNADYAKTYPNILNKEAVKKFIDITYAAYGAGIENFGDMIEAFFTDEPTLTATRNMGTGLRKTPSLPYDYGMIEDFEAKYGVDLKNRLPMLYNDLSNEGKLLRAQFYEYIGTLVSENFFGQINAWCEAHGAKGSGHLLLEEQMLYHIPIYGDYFRSSAAMGYPGFDILNPRPQAFINDMSTGAKYASSPAWLYNKERVFVEICPVVDAEEFTKHHLDYALGTMTFTYFDGGNQVATYYVQANNDQPTGQAFNEYIGRLGSMTVGATNKTQIGVYYAIDTVGANYIPPTDQSVYSPVAPATVNDKLVNELTMALRKQGLDYVFVDDAVIQNGTVTKTSLDFNNFSFTTLLVPRAEIMDLATMQRLCELADKGVNVIFVQNMPQLAMKAADQETLKSLSDAHKDLLCANAEAAVKKVTTTVALTLDTKQTVFVSPWEKNGQTFFFLANADGNEAQITLRHESAKSFRLYDPVSGTITETSDPRVTIAPYRALFVQPIV